LNRCVFLYPKTKTSPRGVTNNLPVWGQVRVKLFHAVPLFSQVDLVNGSGFNVTVPRCASLLYQTQAFHHVPLSRQLDWSHWIRIKRNCFTLCRSSNNQTAISGSGSNAISVQGNLVHKALPSGSKSGQHAHAVNLANPGST
jgi:hypothetical protein